MWKKCEDKNTVYWEKDEKDGFRLTLREIHGESPILRKEIHDETPILTEKSKKSIIYQDFEISPVVVEEWKELWVKVEDSSGRKVDKIYFGANEANKIPYLKGLYSFTFRNYLGKSYIRVKFTDGKEIITDPIEVISSKTTLNENEQNGKLLYCEFLKALIDDLINYLATCPFDLSSPTEFYTEEYSYPPSPVFILHTLAHNAEAIIQALQTIWHNPYRKLATEERWVYLSEAKQVDEDTIVMMLKHPEYLQEYKGGEFGHLTKFLKNNKTDTKYLPLKVYQKQFIETLDNPENRFIKKFMDIILYWCDELERVNILKEDSPHKKQIERLRNYVRYLRADPLFADVGEMTIFPASSQVLLKRDGYRECLNIYRLLHLARIPIFNNIQEAIDNRRIDQLYEFWCFFKLSEMLAKVINGEEAKPKFRIKEGPQSGLEGETEADLGKGYKLVYNKTLKGYTFDFRPDFSLIKDEKNLEIVFDAKFRFDLKELDKDKDLKKLEEAEEEAIREGNLEKVVKVDDVYKMHTYRDALQCRASIVVYPGDKCHFYDVKKGEREIYSLLEVTENLEGVGFIGLRPNN
jgi:predicted component of viral defense system (DUF524 family)